MYEWELNEEGSGEEGSGEEGSGVIDHIFMLIEAGGPEISYLESLGLVETYRRIHPGQGTRNICYCFDNLFLELLWIDDAAAAQSDAIRRTGLYQRSLWRTNRACPFGIAVRHSEPSFHSLTSTWEYKPPYLPTGMSIAVATDSDDPRQPMIFESPGSTSPADWPIEKRGLLQQKAGLGAVTQVQLTMPASSPASGALKAIGSNQSPPVLIDHLADGPGENRVAYRLCLWVASVTEEQDAQIMLPR